MGLNYYEQLIREAKRTNELLDQVLMALRPTTDKYSVEFTGFVAGDADEVEDAVVKALDNAKKKGRLPSEAPVAKKAARKKATPKSN